MALEDELKKGDFRSVVLTAIITALAFVVGLFWKDAITNTINKVVPQGEGLFYNYVAAIIATIIVIIVAWIIIRAQKIKIEEMMKMAEAHAEESRKKIDRRKRAILSARI